jgi:hypothetical protein
LCHVRARDVAKPGRTKTIRPHGGKHPPVKSAEIERSQRPDWTSPGLTCWFRVVVACAPQKGYILSLVRCKQCFLRNRPEPDLQQYLCGAGARASTMPRGSYLT